MLDRENILDLLNQLKLPNTEYCVVAGAALVLHGVKEQTRDVDLGCTNKLFKDLINKGYNYNSKPSGDRYLSVNELVDLFENWLPENFQMISDIPVASLDSIKQMKKKLGRDKDLKDIELIDKFINSRGKK